MIAQPQPRGLAEVNAQLKTQVEALARSLRHCLDGPPDLLQRTEALVTLRHVERSHPQVRA